MNQPQPPSGPVRNLPIWDTVTGTYKNVFSMHLRDLPHAAAFPFLLSTVIALLQVWIAPTTGGDLPTDTPPAPSVGTLALGLLGLIPYVLFTVAWYRLVLLREAPTWLTPWAARHWRTLGYLFGVVAIIIVFALALGAVVGTLSAITGAADNPGTRTLLGVIASLAGAICSIAILLRLSFVFPANAVDERYGFRASWRQTRGQGFRLLAAAILFYVTLIVGSMMVMFVLSIIGVPFLSAGAMPNVSPDLGVTLLSILISGIYVYIATALNHSFFAIAFRTCSGWVPGPPAAALTTGPFEGGGNGET